MPAPSIHAFAEKVALIAGGETPVGRAVALQLALQGAYVVVGTNGAVNDSATEELGRLGTLASHHAVDFNQTAAMNEIVAAVGGQFGRLDMLVNCVPLSVAVSRKENQLDCSALARSEELIASGVELMMTRPKPRIVSVFGSEASKENKLNVGDHVISHGLIGLTRALAASLPAKFRVNAVTLPHSETPEVPVGEIFLRDDRDVAPDDVARIVLFLLSGEAVALNGQVLATSSAVRA